MMKKIYLIQYRGIDASAILETRIKALGSWIKYFESSWLIESSLTAEQIYTAMAVDLKGTSIFIIEVNKSNYYGRMNTSLWDYLKQKK